MFCCLRSSSSSSRNGALTCGPLHAELCLLKFLGFWWHSNINWIKLTHLASFPCIAWKGKRGIAWKGKVNAPPEVGILSTKLYLGHLCRQPLGYCRSWCKGKVACPPSFPAPAAHLPPHCVPPSSSSCCISMQQNSPHHGTLRVGLWGVTFMVWDTWDRLDAVTLSLQPARGIPCSNIFLELSHVYRLIRNTRILGTFKTEGCGDSRVCFTCFKVFVLVFKVCIRSSCCLLWGFFFLNKF